jgi:hypothetical protein
MQEFSREEMAAADPFEGRGVFLAAPGAKSAEMLERLFSCVSATVPAVAWDDIGVWADHGSSGMNAASIRDRWSGGKASEHG